MSPTPRPLAGHSVAALAPLAAAVLVGLGAGGCGDLVRQAVTAHLPDLPDGSGWGELPLGDTPSPTDGADPPDGGAGPDGAGDAAGDGVGLSCLTDEDCAALDDCCYEGWCLNRTCQVRYKEACCTYVGACATQSSLQQATCLETCVAGGCHARLKLPDQGCGRTIWAWAGQASEIPFEVLDGAPEDTVTWHPSTRHALVLPGARGETVSLYAGDMRCPTYHTGPLDAACAPVPGASGAPVSLALATPSIELPWGVPAVAEVWLWASLEALPGDGTPAYDGVELRLRREDGVAFPLWSSRDSPLPPGRWAPVLVDLTPYAGEIASLVVRFDTRDGIDNDHEGVYLGSLVVRAPCASERACPSPTPCAGGRLVPIAGLDDRLCVPAPADPEVACVACTSRDDCPLSPPGAPADPCDEARCLTGRCVWDHVLTAGCCTPQDAWPGPPSFEAPLDGWTLSPSPGPGTASGWSRSDLQAYDGQWSLRFGALTPDGVPEEGLLAPPDEAGSGEAWAPPTVVPREAPALVFWVSLSTEWDAAPGGANPLGIDLLRVAVRRVGADFPPAVVWDSMALGGTTQGAWARVEAPLDAFAGLPIQVGFLFDTGDSAANEGAVFLDDPALVRRCPAPALGP